MAELHASPLHRRTFLIPPVRQDFPRSSLTWDFVSVKGHARIPFKPCRCFRSDEGGGVVEKKKGNVSKNEKLCGKIGLDSKGDGNELLGAIRSFVWRFSKPSSRSKALEQLEEKLSWVAVQFARYFVTMMSTGVILLIGFQLSGGDSQMNELIWYSWLGGIFIGTMIGSNMVLEEVSRAGPRNVVITGSTRGLGKALAREFSLSGDRVVVASRSPESVNETIKELEENLQQLSINSGSSSSKEFAQAKVVGIACDVSVPADVRKLANYSVKELGSIDIWVNNAGTNKGFRPLLQFADDDIQQIVSTNLVGSILCTREAMKIMQSQKRGGHIFNMDGAGSGGSSTPLTAVYGSTKCGLRQLQSSLLKESRRSNVGVHTASPGMVLTDLLLSGSSIKNKQMFNIICELPETVARTLVPRMRVVKGSGKAINYLTPPRILLALVTAWLRRGRWFDDQVTHHSFCDLLFGDNLWRYLILLLDCWHDKVSFNQIFSKLRIVSNQYWCFLVRGLHLLLLRKLHVTMVVNLREKAGFDSIVKGQQYCWNSREGCDRLDGPFHHFSIHFIIMVVSAN